MAEYLNAHRDQLGPQSHLEVTRRFSSRKQRGDEDHSEQDEEHGQSSGEASLRQLDEEITQAMANMDYPQQWKNTERQPREGKEVGSESVGHKL